MRLIIYFQVQILFLGTTIGFYNFFFRHSAPQTPYHKKLPKIPLCHFLNDDARWIASPLEGLNYYFSLSSLTLYDIIITKYFEVSKNLVFNLKLIVVYCNCFLNEGMVLKCSNNHGNQLTGAQSFKTFLVAYTEVVHVFKKKFQTSCYCIQQKLFSFIKPFNYSTKILFSLVLNTK